jgi:phosphatidylserine/phosphatidylglycerophosphate/cardiolipin synthase-like enzyme
MRLIHISRPARPDTFGRLLITGSFNFTKSAEEKNAENLLVIRDNKLAGQYTKNWQEHDRHSEVYAG